MVDNVSSSMAAFTSHSFSGVRFTHFNALYTSNDSRVTICYGPLTLWHNGKN